MATTETRTDPTGSAELVSRARDGDSEAYCVLAEACELRLFRQAVALCRDAALAEDLVAETLIEAWRSLHRFDGTCRFSTWLYSILVHRFQKAARRARARPLSLAALPSDTATEGELLLGRVADASPLPSARVMDQERAAHLRAAIEVLPGTHQQVVLLRFYEGASLPEIAGALGLPLGTVKSRLHHALEKLRRMRSVVNLSADSGDTMS